MHNKTAGMRDRMFLPAVWQLLAASLVVMGITNRVGAAQVPQPWPQEMLVDADLADVFFVDKQVGWAVGDRGVIWRTGDGGRTWQQRSSAPRAVCRHRQSSAPSS